MDKPKVPPIGGIVDPQQLRAKQIMEEEEKRFQEIADEIIAVLIKHSVQYKELDRVIRTFGGKINGKVGETLLNEILKL